ncbi:DUF3800 domain-containing protein [Trinickia sp.]|uniref:DUF3800 domain-containing protein n=1 Tax=Trinickia sp. TaxID=2571163 RepID=UPI003F7FEFFF
MEVPLFLDSKASRLIQMADIVAYWTFRYFQSSDHRGFSLIRPFCADRGDANDGLITDLSTETTAKLANAAPHKHPFPFPAATARPAAMPPAIPDRDSCKYRPHPRTQLPREAALR